jgi:hypothetical protein
MAESASSSSSSSPPIRRSPHKPLEYTSCIDTKPLSLTTISTSGNINLHSSFDDIRQPRNCDNFETKNDNNNHIPQHRKLERDLRRLDIDPNKSTIKLTCKKLDRTESISLPTTPIEQISSSFNHQCHPLLLLQTNKDEKHIRLTSSTDYMLATSEQLIDESMSNSKR